jgi:hypothetical protein
MVMNITLAFALFPILLFGTPVFAQSLCIDCIKTAQEQLKQCLSNAISQEDKMSCAEKQQTKAKTCESGACVIERTNSQNNNTVLSQKK